METQTWLQINSEGQPRFYSACAAVWPALSLPAFPTQTAASKHYSFSPVVHIIVCFWTSSKSFLGGLENKRWVCVNGFEFKVSICWRCKARKFHIWVFFVCYIGFFVTTLKAGRRAFIPNPSIRSSIYPSVRPPLPPPSHRTILHSHTAAATTSGNDLIQTNERREKKWEEMKLIHSVIILLHQQLFISSLCVT